MTRATLLTPLVRRLTAILFSVLLSACGGGGGEGQTTAPIPSSGANGGQGFPAESGNTATPSPGGLTSSPVVGGVSVDVPLVPVVVVPPVSPSPSTPTDPAAPSPATPGSPPAAPPAIGSARFAYPTGIDSDAEGNLYVVDAGNRTIRKITPAGTVTTLAGSAGVQGTADGVGAAAQFHSPFGIAVDSGGNAYVTDGNAVRKVSRAGEVTTLAGVVGEAGLADRSGTAALFYLPQGITVDTMGNVYVADTGNNAIRKISVSGVVTTVDRGSYRAPHSVLASGSDLYVGDDYNVWKISFGNPGYSVTRWVGEPGSWSSVDGPATTARFWPLRAMTIDAANNLFVVESFLFAKQQGAHGLVRRITPDRVTSTFAGNGTGSADGMGTAAQFSLPLGITTDGQGNMYVADTHNHTIRRISPLGLVTTFVGKAGELGSSDGIP